MNTGYGNASSTRFATYSICSSSSFITGTYSAWRIPRFFTISCGQLIHGHGGGYEPQPT
ncbi:MAG: hypothetical protein ACLU8D_14500 [Enterocloster sp.]